MKKAAAIGITMGGVAVVAAVAAAMIRPRPASRPDVLLPAAPPPPTVLAIRVLNGSADPDAGRRAARRIEAALCVGVTEIGDAPHAAGNTSLWYYPAGLAPFARRLAVCLEAPEARCTLRAPGQAVPAEIDVTLGDDSAARLPQEPAGDGEQNR